MAEAGASPQALCLRAVIRWYNFCYIARPPPLQPEARCFFWAFPFFIIPNSFAAAEDPMTRTETLELVKDYYRINNRNLAKRLKQCIHEAAKTMYNQKNDDEPR